MLASADKCQRACSILTELQPILHLFLSTSYEEVMKGVLSFEWVTLLL